MKTRKVFVVITSLFFLVLFNSCKKDGNEVVINPTTSYYFTGTIENQKEYWSAGIDNFQLYHGWGATNVNSGDTSYYWMLGIDQWPVPENNKGLIINLPVTYNIGDCTSEEFRLTFREKTYELKGIFSDSGIKIDYYEHGEVYSTEFGPQSGSYVNCILVSETVIYGVPDVVNTTWTFGCKLYKSDGTYYKEIKQAEMKTSVYRIDI